MCPLNPFDIFDQKDHHGPSEASWSMPIDPDPDLSLLHQQGLLLLSQLRHQRHLRLQLKGWLHQLRLRKDGATDAGRFNKRLWSKTSMIYPLICHIYPWSRLISFDLVWSVVFSAFCWVRPVFRIYDDLCPDGPQKCGHRITITFSSCGTAASQNIGPAATTTSSGWRKLTWSASTPWYPLVN